MATKPKFKLPIEVLVEHVCKTLGIPAPVDKRTGETRVVSTRAWRIDFAWPEVKVALEVDGGIWRKGGGAHSRPRNIMRDMEKSNAMEALGWRLIRARPEEIVVGSTAMVLLGEVYRQRVYGVPPDVEEIAAAVAIKRRRGLRRCRREHLRVKL